MSQQHVTDLLPGGNKRFGRHEIRVSCKCQRRKTPVYHAGVVTCSLPPQCVYGREQVMWKFVFKFLFWSGLSTGAFFGEEIAIHI
jgi:hypothetical protein